MRMKPERVIIVLLVLLLVASVGFDAHGAFVSYFLPPRADAGAMPGMHMAAGPVDLSDPNAAAQCPMLRSERAAAAPGDACGMEHGSACPMDQAATKPAAKPTTKSGASAQPAEKASAKPVAKPTAKPVATTGDKVSAATYICTMCPDVKSDKPGQCPKCGMDLVKKK